jgi:hypothetical protein
MYINKYIKISTNNNKQYPNADNIKSIRQIVTPTLITINTTTPAWPPQTTPESCQKSTS